MKRKNRGNNAKNKKPQGRKVELSKRSIAAVAAALQEKENDNASDSDEDEEGPNKRQKKSTNRNHKALTRKSQKDGS